MSKLRLRGLVHLALGHELMRDRAQMRGLTAVSVLYTEFMTLYSQGALRCGKGGKDGER